MNIIHNIKLPCVYCLGLIISEFTVSECTPIIAKPIRPSLSQSIWHGNNVDGEDVITSNVTTSHPHEGCKLLIQDQLPPQPMLVGKKFEQDNAVNLNYKVENEAGSTAATCNEQNMAGGYPCRNVDLLSIMETSVLNTVFENYAIENNIQSPPAYANDVWGWTHTQSGREFALIGMYGGTAFVEVTDPHNPIYIGGLPSVHKNYGGWSFWRDCKTVGDYALIVSEESGNGMQIFDLTELLAATELPILFDLTTFYNKIGSAHNIFVNEETSFAYIVGQNNCRGGLHMVNLSDPTQPFFAGCYSDQGYTHGRLCMNVSRL